MLEFRLLGPVEVRRDGQFVEIGPPKRRTLLAMLLLANDALVTNDRLTDALWGEQPPRHAKTVIQGHVSQLRRLLHPVGPVTIATACDGYLLQTPADRIDGERFRAAVAEARTGDGAPAGIPELRKALALWRGPALAGLCGTPPVVAAAAELEEARLGAVEELGQALTAGRRAEEAVAVLRGPADRHPLRESLVALLLDALLSTNRQAEAIELYHRTARLLGDELGVDPGPAMVEAYDRILGPPRAARRREDTHRPGGPHGQPGGLHGQEAADRQEATRRQADAHRRADGHRQADAHRGAGQPGAHGLRRPLLLPRRPAGFTGRKRELAALDAAVRHAAHDSPICLVTGPAGIGKSALVAHWAQQASADFPDGVLFARLGGFVDTAPIADPAFVIRDFLGALGIQPDDIPQNTAAAEALYRSLLRNRRLLVILDDALSYDQVRPLLPGAQGCATVVTSRNRLESLVAGDCARPLLLDRLGPGEGEALFARILGPDRVGAEPDAAGRLVRLCDGLPLALRLAAARLAVRPERSLGDAVEELRDGQRRISFLAVDGIDFASVLRVSVDHLPPDAVAVLRLLAHHFGPDIDVAAVAALADDSTAGSRAVLERLVAANLVEERGHDRYALHGLIRLFARSLGPAPGGDRLLPLLDHYLYAALAAASAAVAGSQPCCRLPEDFRTPVSTPVFADREEAMAWYARERRNLVAATAAAAAGRHHHRAWRLALLLWPLVVQQPGADWEAPLGHALGSAVELAEADAESRVRSLLGWVLGQNGRYEEALPHLLRAPDLARRADDTEGEAIATANLAQAREALGDTNLAGLGYERAAQLARRAGSPQTEMLTTYYLARYHLLNERPAKALALAQCALDLAPEDQVVARRAMLLDICGRALATLDRNGEAWHHFDRAGRLAEQDGFNADAADYYARAAAVRTYGNG
ncbi:BTAD domain-containing putative transcriptional regulator [Kitasatospora sp. NBC_01300]|uniref:AfsR/SARP family transcriptional regulator n=1 Tax=Kitasatospora sp. NBC_01300 TaxID=2903574 RepID=UPI00352C7ADB|nr:AAA family ATPase [Kitasatospora sp. NBC_01300]